MRNFSKSSRSITPSSGSLWQQIYLSDALDPFYNITQWLRAKYKMICRMLFWGWKMRYSWDFDASTVYEMLHLKLDRVHSCMKENGHLMWNASPDTNLMRKLAEAKMLAKKLGEDKYMQNIERFHDSYTKVAISDDWITRSFAKFHPNAKPIPAKMYSFFFKKAYEMDNKEKHNDKERLYFLLDKHLENWWD